MMLLPPARLTRKCAALLGGACALVLLSGLSTALGRLETWREESSSAFGKGKRERVVVSDDGRVRLARTLKPFGKLDAPRVWDLARGPDGRLYAATGDEGKVFSRESKEGSDWSLAYKATDTQALSLAVGRDGHIFLGTGPSGQVIDVSDPKTPGSRPDPGVRYIWDLAGDAKGNIYAATGPTGQLWKRSPEGAWSLLLDSHHPHLLSVAVAPDGSVYAGSDGEGLVYKVDPAGKATVVYDAPQSEVRALLVTPEGVLYAGTAAEAGGRSGRGPSSFPSGSTTRGDRPSSSPDSETVSVGPGPIETQPPAPKPDPSKKDEARTRSSSPSGGGSAAPKPPSPGDNAVYRIDRDGVAREVFRAKTLIYALAAQDDRILVGTGPEGQLYELRDDGQDSSAVARLDSSQILTLLNQPDGGVLIGTAGPGSVVRLEPGYAASGTLVSEVKDAKLISRFGAVSWRAKRPPKTSVSLQVRSGHVAEPDATWSEWSAAQTDPDGASGNVPPGRFVQYRATLSTMDPSVSPELESVSLRYQSINLAPEIAKLNVPDVSALDGSARQSRLTFRWEVNDPNDDDLHYTLFLRKDGWPGWIKLNDQPLTERSYAWDATSVPSGLYQLRLSASDRPSNNPEDALAREKVSEGFLVDHEAPEVVLKPQDHEVAATLTDRLTRIVKASYAIDGGDWTPVFPDDGLFDTPRESITVRLPELKPGTHVLVLRATDAAGNVGAADTLISR
jgi:hypothetical protein